MKPELMLASPRTWQLIDHLAEVLNRLVQPILAIIFGVTIVYMAIAGTITSGEFLGIAAVVVGFFFQAQRVEKDQERLVAAQDQLVELAKALPPESARPPGS